MVSEIVSNYIKTKTQGVEIVSDYFKNKTKGVLEILSKYFQNPHTLKKHKTLKFFQITSKTKEEGFPRFFQKNVFQKNFKLLQKQDVSGPGYFFKLPKNQCTERSPTFFQTTSKTRHK